MSTLIKFDKLNELSINNIIARFKYVVGDNMNGMQGLIKIIEHIKSMMLAIENKDDINYDQLVQCLIVLTNELKRLQNSCSRFQLNEFNHEYHINSISGDTIKFDQIVDHNCVEYVDATESNCILTTTHNRKRNLYLVKQLEKEIIDRKKLNKVLEILENIESCEDLIDKNFYEAKSSIKEYLNGESQSPIKKIKITTSQNTSTYNPTLNALERAKTWLDFSQRLVDSITDPLQKTLIQSHIECRRKQIQYHTK
jgi:hypothetical protein